MSTREIVNQVLARLPEDVSLQDLARELEFVAGVRAGFAELDAGQGVPIEEVEKMLGEWTRRPTK